MKASHRKTEYLCVNKRNSSETERLQGTEVMKGDCFRSNGIWERGGGVALRRRQS